jgi:hypothetical protein
MASVEIFESKAPISEEKITAFEKEIDHKLPDDYREFLLKHNGGYPKPRAFDICWSTEEQKEEFTNSSLTGWFYHLDDEETSNLLKSFHMKRKWIPKDTIAIGYDAGGSEILLGTYGENRGKIFYWVNEAAEEESDNPGYENVGFIANSFQEFLDSLH